MSEPAKRETATPKQSPGEISGNKTPSDIPTKAALMDRTYSATIATSNPTGRKRGSRNVNVRKPEIMAARKPEKSRGWLQDKQGVSECKSERKM